jgi:hypothetical protein
VGYREEQLQVTARLSAHKDERDAEATELWADLSKKAAEATEDPMYADISPAICW